MKKNDLILLKELLTKLRDELELEKTCFEMTKGKDHWVTLCTKVDLVQIDEALEVINRR